MPKKSQNIERIRTVKAAHETELMAWPGVVSVGVGLRQRGGQISGEVCVVVMVRHKLPPADLRPADMLPAEVDGVPVDVQEAGDIAVHNP